jgi:6-phosphofructokinase 1
VQRIYGFRYGYAGFTSDASVVGLTPHVVADIHEQGGTFLGSSRGPQAPSAIVDRLVAMEIKVLFVIGGDGTTRGALAIAEEIGKRRQKIAVVGIPKTIDNDIAFIDRSFGFETAYSTAMVAIRAAHNEARGAPNGIALVKLMGRHSGFIACHATLASSHVNFALIPEVPFQLEGPNGFLEALRSRLKKRNHAVVVVAEGAGQDLLENEGQQRDASGNVKLKDIGVFLAERIRAYFADRNEPASLKYIDPSYIIRSVAATPADSVYCWRLAQHSVHAAMAGKTKMVVASWHGRLVHVPMQEAISRRKQVDPHGDLWLSVLEATGQPEMS